jgi:hypothetical protein
MGADRPQDPPEVQIPHIHFGSQVTHLEESTKTNRPLNRTLVAFALKSMNRNKIFRHFRETPVRWLDGNRLSLLLEGDCGVPPDVLSYRGEVVISLNSKAISTTRPFVTEKEDG